MLGVWAWSGYVSALDVYWNVPTEEVRRNGGLEWVSANVELFDGRVC